MFCRDEPHRVVGARQGSPLVVGLGQNENFLASDAGPGRQTDQIIYLEDGDVVDLQLARVDRRPGRQAGRAQGATVQVHTGAAELGPYRHFMQKEIFEQPRGDTLQDIESITPELFGDGAYKVFKEIDSLLIRLRHQLLRRADRQVLDRVHRPHSGGGGNRQRVPLPRQRAQLNALVVTISQSGETADTLAALKHARSLGMQHTLTVCNVATSAMVRECELAYITRAGVEIGVASTKAFTTQLTALFLLTLAWRRRAAASPRSRRPST